MEIDSLSTEKRRLVACAFADGSAKPVRESASDAGGRRGELVHALIDRFTRA